MTLISNYDTQAYPTSVIACTARELLLTSKTRAVCSPQLNVIIDANLFPCLLFSSSLHLLMLSLTLHPRFMSQTSIDMRFDNVWVARDHLQADRTQGTLPTACPTTPPTPEPGQATPVFIFLRHLPKLRMSLLSVLLYRTKRSVDGL